MISNADRRRLATLAAQSDTLDEKAYFIVFESLPSEWIHSKASSDQRLSKTLTAKPISAEQICWRFHDTAFHQLGSSAAVRLRAWGLHSTACVGQIIHELIEAKLVHPTRPPGPGDYNAIFEFDQEFNESLDFPRIETSQQTSVLYRWTITKLFVATAMIAVLLATIFQNGISMMLLLLSFGAMFVAAGAFIIWMARTELDADRWLLTLFGFSLASFGICFWSVAIYTSIHS